MTNRDGSFSNPFEGEGVRLLNARDQGPSDDSVRWDLALLYAAAIAGYPLIATIPVALGLPSRLVTVPYRAVVLGVSLLSLWRTVRKKEMYDGVFWWPFLLFWFSYLARMAADTLLFPQELALPRGEYFLNSIGMTLIPALPLFARPSAATLVLACRLLIIMGVSALAAVLVLGGRVLLGNDLAVAAMSGRFEILTLNPISLGHLGVSLTIVVAAMLLLKPPRSLPWRLALVGALGLGLGAAGLSASKGPLMALALGAACLIAIDWRRGHTGRALTALLVFPAFGIEAALLIEERLGFGVISRIQTALDDPSVESVSVRLDLLHNAWRQFLAHPFLGSSLEERINLMYPHNSIVEGFMAIGIVGGVIYMVCFGTGVWRAVRLIATRPSAAWVGILCLQYALSSLVSGGIWGDSEMWALFAACIAITASSPARSVQFSTPVRSTKLSAPGQIPDFTL